jgi:hypothetical protein
MVSETEAVVGTGLTERRVIEPATGQVFSLDASEGNLAFALEEAREMERKLYAFRKKVGKELLARMDRQGEWTMRVDGFIVKGESPAPKVEWDGHDLALAIGDLVMQGKIDQKAAEAAVEEVRTFKPKQRGINALLKLPGVKEYLEHCKREEVRERRPPSVRRATASD